MAEHAESTIEESRERRARGALWRALRPHQWAKNGLLLAPIVLAHRALASPEKVGAALLAVACFSAVSSAGYLLNDWLDRDADRQHAEKRKRPLASGDLSGRTAAGAFAALLVFAFAASLAVLPGGFTFLLAVYGVLTVSYSLDLKRRALVDVLTLAALYTLRILAGGAAAQVPVSPWLLVFSMFFFLSLAFAKRYTELVAAVGRDRTTLAGRGYRVDDLSLVPVMGISAGFMSMLVIGLWASSADVRELYRQPTLLWLTCPVLFHWITRIWLLAHRGQLHSDPVLFAVTDRASYVSGALLLAIGAAAARGLGA